MDGVIEQLGKVLVQGAVAILVSITCEVEIASHEPVAINMADNPQGNAESQGGRPERKHW